MSERKSGRARKAVDYTKFGVEDDLDDDFADSTPPASKKPRLSNKENKEKKGNKKEIKEPQKVEKEVKQRRSSKSLEDHRYERELQEALQLSLSQSDQETTGSPTKTHQTEALPVIIEDEEQSVPSPVLPAVDNTPVLTRMSKAEDDIEVLETSIEEVPSSRQATGKKKKVINSDSESGGEDSDFAPDDEDDDSFDDTDDDIDDYDPEDSDSDFGSSRKKKSTKKTVTKSNSSKTSTKTAKDTKTTAGSAKPSTTKSGKTQKALAGKTGITTKPLAASSPSCRTPGSGLTAQKPPNWKPPGSASEGKSLLVPNSKTNNAVGKSPIGLNTKCKPAVSGAVGRSPLGGVNIKSPSSGLRLGLSRNMKLKPLHPNLKMQ